MKKYLMVCLGNICRSPVAEGLLRQHLLEQGKEALVDSCGTNGLHNGEAPDPRSQRSVKERGGDISHLVSRQITTQDFDAFDTLFVMDTNNYNTVRSLAQNDAQRSKVHMIINEIYPNENMPVPDPYYGGEAGFKRVYDLLDEATKAIADRT